MGYEAADPVAAVGSLIVLSAMLLFAVLVFRPTLGTHITSAAEVREISLRGRAEPLLVHVLQSPPALMEAASSDRIVHMRRGGS